MSDIPDARITPTDVFIGGQKLPGFIEQGGVTVTPGGYGGVNTVTVRFIVGRVEVEDVE